MSKRLQIGALILVLVIVGVAGRLTYAKEEKNVTLELGVFVGSNWDVANADSCTIIDDAIAKFQEVYPNVKVHYYSGIPKEDYSEWIAQKALTGDMPDVFMALSTDFDKLSSLGLMENLDGYMQQDESFHEDKYYAAALEYGQNHGKQYALPYETVPTLMFVNKTLLTQEGFSVPKNDWTWDDLTALCESITKDTDGDGKIDQFGTYNYDWRLATYSNGGKLFDNNGTMCYANSKQVSEAVKFVEKLNTYNEGEKPTQEDFDIGKVAFMPLSFAEYRTYKSYPYKMQKYTNFQWDCISLPAGPRGGNTSEVTSLLMGISQKSQHKSMAWELLKTLTYNKEIQMEIFKYSQGASVIKEVTDSAEAEQLLKQDTEETELTISHEILSTVIENGMVPPRFAKYSDAMALLEGEVLKISEDEKNVDSSLKIANITLSHFLNQ